MKRFTILFIFIGIIGILLFGKFHIGMIRTIDPDEFYHANWAYMIANGSLPYRDFFLLFTPLFHFILATFFLLPEGPYLIILMRITNWFVYVGITGIFWVLVKRFSKSKITAFLSCLIFLTFPIIFDKTIDIRPDSFMIFLFLIGIYFILVNTRPLLSGLFIGTSGLLLSKIVFAIPSLLFLLITIPKPKKRRVWFWFITGAIIPYIVFFLYLTANNILSIGLDTIIRGSLTLNFSADAFSPLEALYPWPLIYTIKGGVSIPWIVQIGIWILGVLGIPVVIKANKRIGIFLLLYIFTSAALLFYYKHPFLQYFIPLSLGFSITSASVISAIVSVIPWRTMKYAFVSCFILPLFISFIIQYKERIIPGNIEQLEVLRLVHQYIPKHEPMVDLVGSFLYRPNGFFYSCAHYASFIYVYDPKAPTLIESLVRTQTKYIVLDQKAYIFTIPPPDDIQFIVTHYLPSSLFKIYTPGVKFVCNRGTCIQQNLHSVNAYDQATSTFSLHIKGSYRLMTIPSRESILLKNSVVTDGEIINLSPQTYRFTVPPSLSSFTLQYKE